MTRTGPIALPTPDGGPDVHLLDAHRAGLDERELRALARSICQASSAPFASRSYRYPYAIVAWHTGPVGIDVERIEHCDPGFAGTICSPAESVEWWSVTNPHRYFSSMWSSKEALAKALGSPVDYDPRHLEAPMLWPDQRAGSWHTAELPAPSDHVAWLCWRAAQRCTSAGMVVVTRGGNP